MVVRVLDKLGKILLGTCILGVLEGFKSITYGMLVYTIPEGYTTNLNDVEMVINDVIGELNELRGGLPWSHCCH